MSTEMQNEEKIRALFEETHESQAPPPAFQPMWRRALGGRETQRPGPLRWSLPAALAGALTLAVILSAPWKPPMPSAGAPVIADAALDSTSWHGPTDFLLRTPGYDFLERVPEPSMALGLDTSPFNIDSSEENSP
ncbi:MAG: hypothetical protein AAF481_17005 [Acidobacteriota bacterium]